MEAKASANDSKVFTNLRIFNLVMGFLHLLQGTLMLVLSNDTKYALTTSFLRFNPNAAEPVRSVTEELVKIPLGPAISAFLFISAIAHFTIAAPGVYEWYVKNLKKGANYARWYEYSISSSLMIGVIGILCGMFDAPSLILLMALNACMIFFGLVMELHNQTTKKTDWTSFIYGCFAGIVPWLILGWYFFDAIANVETTNPVPKFVYGILISLFVFFNVFAVNMFLQYKKVGPWKNYLFGEKMYIVLSLLAKSALAWQVFSGTLR